MVVDNLIQASQIVIIIVIHPVKLPTVGRHYGFLAIAEISHAYISDTLTDFYFASYLENWTLRSYRGNVDPYFNIGVFSPNHQVISDYRRVAFVGKRV